MTDLQKKLREKVAWKRETAYDEYPHVTTYREKCMFLDGQEHEFNRLAPILAALEGCVEALEDQIEMELDVYGRTFNALETLRTALERLEGKP